ncbi:MAG: tetratricopeptide repeat protein [Desulfuromonadaceae bacterium]|nr:tetratricopeptide repeat protein [Desulfuromonadaceae bacterium]
MTIMTLLLLLILFMVFFIYFLQLNPVEIAIVFYPDHVIQASPAVVVVACIVLGLTVGYLLHLYGAASYLLKGWRRTRSEKREREVTELHREGLARLRSGDSTKARRLLQKALSMDGGRIEVLSALAEVQLADGEVDESISLLQRARKLAPKDLTVLFALAETYGKTQQLSEAADCYRELLDLDGDNYQGQVGLRDLYLAQQQWSDALAVQKRLVKKGAGEVQAAEKVLLNGLRYQTAQQAEAEERFDEALAGYQKLAKDAPDFLPAQVSLGEMLRQQGRSEQAAATWQAGYRRFGHSVFLKRLEQQAMAEENPTTLLDYYRQQVADHPDDLLLRFFFGKFCLRVEMVDEALEQLHGLEKSCADFPQLHLVLAESHMRRQRLSDAVAEYQKALGGEDRFRFGYVCQECGAATSSWQGRCEQCGCWGCLNLSDVPSITNLPAPEVREIHHGERD